MTNNTEAASKWVLYSEIKDAQRVNYPQWKNFKHLPDADDAYDQAIDAHTDEVRMLWQDALWAAMADLPEDVAETLLKCAEDHVAGMEWVHPYASDPLEFDEITNMMRLLHTAYTALNP